VTVSSQIIDDISAWFAEQDVLADGDVAVLGGSLAAGLGNATSDVDVYVLRGEAEPTLEGHQFFVCGRRVDFHDCTAAWFESAVGTLEEHVAAGDGAASDDLHTLVYRLLNGVPLSSRSIASDLRDRGNKALRSSLLDASGVRLEELWHDLRVCQQQGDVDREGLAVGAFTEEALYGALAHRGLTYPNRKWNAEKSRQLPDAEPVFRLLDDLTGSLGSAPTSDRARQAVVDVLASLGPRPRLDAGPLYPRWHESVSVHAVGGRWYAVRGTEAFEVSESTCVLLDLCDGTRQVADGLAELHATFGTSPARISEDARHALQDCYGYGLIRYDRVPTPRTPPAVPVSRPQVFEPSIEPVGPVRELLEEWLVVWSSWVDFLSHRDDFSGALAQGQYGAAVAATRSMCFDMLRAVAARRGSGAGYSDEIAVARRHFGLESNEYARLVEVLALPGTGRSGDVRTLEDAVEICVAEFRRLPVPYRASLLDEEGHAELFVHVRQLLDMASASGVQLRVSDMLLEKVRQYGTPEAVAGG
jgi:hypothetical protein